MLKGFPIDFVRQAFEQKLLEEHRLDKNLFGGKEQVNIFSFYEQLKSQDEVNRFVENYRELTEQQNRNHLILNGVLISPENPSITNLYSCLIVPLTWSTSLRCQIQDRDQALVTLNNLITKLKGKKVDIAQLDCIDEEGRHYAQPFMVGTIGQNDGTPTLKNGDYIGNFSNIEHLSNIFDNLYDKNVVLPILDDDEALYFYAEDTNNHKLEVIKATAKYPDVLESMEGIISTQDNIIEVHVQVAENLTADDIKYAKGSFFIQFTDETEILVELETDRINHVAGQPDNYLSLIFQQPEFEKEVAYIDYDLIEVFKNTPIVNDYNVTIVEDDGIVDKIVFPPEHESFEKYKMSFSFDTIRCDEPRNLNANEYCDLTLSGSATLVSAGVKLGNDLLKISISKIGINAETPISYDNPPIYWLEPLELPSGNSANTQINQLISNNFVTNTHTDSIALTLQYTFILDTENDFLEQLYNYGRYGTQGTGVNDISPNMKYNVNEIWCSWGKYESNEIITKLVENVDIENTESDTLTIGITMQIQGENE